MRNIIIIAWIALSSAQATIINVDLGPAPRVVTGDIFVTSNGLDGTPMAGQTLSIDYQFNHPIRTHTDYFYVAIRALTNRAPAPDGLYPQVSQLTGFFVRPDGSSGPMLCLGPLGIFNPDSSDVLFGLAWMLQPPDASLPAAKGIFTGMHFDMTLPDLAGVEIEGLRLHFDPNDSGRRVNPTWVVLNSTVPDGGGSIALLVLALAGLASVRFFKDGGGWLLLWLGPMLKVLTTYSKTIFCQQRGKYEVNRSDEAH